MALATTTHWSIISGSTASNVNGGGFNISNANFLTDFTTDSNTANTDSPVISSASYSFVAGDASAWFYVSAGTDWTPGFYQIASVAANKATLSAAVGAAVQYNAAQNRWKPSTVAGCATVGTPTGGTCGVDFSQQTAAEINSTDGASTASTTFSSVVGGFRRIMTGNILHLISATGADELVGWYEVVNYTDANTIVLDRVSGTYTVGDFYIGGAMSLNSTLDDDFFEILEPGNWVWLKGALSLGEAVAISSGGDGTSTNVITREGYATVRGDMPTGSTRPTITGGANGFTSGNFQHCRHIIHTGTAAVVYTSAASCKISVCKFVNTSTTANRSALAASDSVVVNNEAISYRGYAINTGNTVSCIAFNYVHDSGNGLISSSTTAVVNYSGNIVESCVTAAISLAGTTTAPVFINGNTLFGSTNTTGIGISMVTGVRHVGVINNIITGFVTGVDHADTQNSGYDDYNDYHNNDADVSATGEWQKGVNDVAVAPVFTSVSQVTFATATTSGSVVTQTGATFVTNGVTVGRDFLYLVSGTGITAGVYGITAVTETTLTLDIAPGTSATADKVGQITTGRNFMITGNI